MNASTDNSHAKGGQSAGQPVENPASAPVAQADRAAGCPSSVAGEAVAPYNRVLHWLAVLTTLATFPLIFMGGLVTSHDVGLSVPDWPNSYGYNMFLFPPNQWVGGILYEHSHRLMGTVVGFLSVLVTLFAWGVACRDSVRRSLAIGALVGLVATIAASVAAWIGHPGWEDVLKSRAAQVAVSFAGLALTLAAACLARRREERGWVRWLALSVLAAVLLQGLLGGLRVVMLKLNLAIVHACIAQAFFCLAALLAIVTSRWWIGAQSMRESPAAEAASPGSLAVGSRAGKRLVRLAAATWVVIFAQLIVGATMRHYKAGLAIPDVPYAFGRWVPPTDPKEVSDAFYAHVTIQESFEMDEPTVTQVWLAYGHRVGAVLVSAFVLWLAFKILRRHLRTGLVVPAALLLVLLEAQVALGLFVVIYRKPADITSIHVAVGALTLLTTFVVAVRAMRLYSPVKARAPRALGFEVGPARPTVPGGVAPAAG